MKQTKEKPLVAVVIPVYNGEKFIKEAIESVIRQTYTNWECHIINNVSTDKTREIVFDMASKDSRIILHNYDDFFPIVDNWNRTALHIPENAEYYKLLQADDWIDPLCLEEMVRVMETHPTTGMCSSYRIDGTKVNCDGLDYYAGEFYRGKELLMRHLLQKIDITGSATTLMFRVSALKKLPVYPQIFDPKDFHCDTQLAFDIMNISDVGFVFKVLSYTRWHPEAYTSSICVICSTFLNGREIRLHKFQNLDPLIKREYIKHRIHYAYYILKNSIKGNKKCIEWHKNRIQRKFTSSEFIKAFWQYNPLNFRINKLFKKLKLA